MSERPRLFQLDDLDFVHYDSCGRICIKVKLLLSAWDSCSRVAETEGYVDICLEDVVAEKIDQKLREKTKLLVEHLFPPVKEKEVEKVSVSAWDNSVTLRVGLKYRDIPEIAICLSTQAEDWLIRETAQLAAAKAQRFRAWREFAREAFQEVINDEEVRAKFVEFLRAIARKMEEYGRKHGLVLARREE